MPAAVDRRESQEEAKERTRNHAHVGSKVQRIAPNNQCAGGKGGDSVKIGSEYDGRFVHQNVAKHAAADSRSTSA
jgi:hypothetical protein